MANSNLSAQEVISQFESNAANLTSWDLPKTQKYWEALASLSKVEVSSLKSIVSGASDSCWQGVVSKFLVGLQYIDNPTATISLCFYAEEYEWEILQQFYELNILDLKSKILYCNSESKRVLDLWAIVITSTSLEVKQWLVENREAWFNQYLSEAEVYEAVAEVEGMFALAQLEEEEFNLECIVFAYQIKVLSDIKRQGDTVLDVKPEFYQYSTDVLSLAKSKKQEEFQRAVAEGELMFGVELEFSHSKYPLAVLYALMSMGIFKWDSSVDGEYVTLPYSYQEMVTKLSNLSETFDKLLSANGSEGNGMHVHVSRAALTELQVHNLKALFHKRGLDYYSYWEEIADRGLVDNHYCKFPQQMDDYEKSRYWVLNTQNEHTLEFRMFKSPTTTKKVLWNLSVVMGLLEFCKDSCDMNDWMISPLNPMNQ